MLFDPRAWLICWFCDVILSFQYFYAKFIFFSTKFVIFPSNLPTSWKWAPKTKRIVTKLIMQLYWSDMWWRTPVLGRLGNIMGRVLLDNSSLVSLSKLPRDLISVRGLWKLKGKRWRDPQIKSTLFRIHFHSQIHKRTTNHKETREKLLKGSSRATQRNYRVGRLEYSQVLHHCTAPGLRSTSLICTKVVVPSKIYTSLFV